MGLSLADLPYLIALPMLVCVSGFFSGSETALFGLSNQQRLNLARSGGAISRAVAALTEQPRMLLITLMLGNMAVNVTFFVISSILQIKLARADAPVLVLAAATVGPLLLIILLGEVAPKLLANTARVGWVKTVAVPMALIHRTIWILRVILAWGVINPLGRLIAPTARPANLSADELNALLDMSHNRGVIAEDEQRLMRNVMGLNQLKVTDLMIPRVDLVAVDLAAGAGAMRRLIDDHRVARVIAYENDLDHVSGVIYTRQFLLASRGGAEPKLTRLTRNVRFVPELMRVDRLLEEFRKTGTQLAIAVDEYGGTAGLITLKDIVKQMLGELDLEHGFPEPAASDIQPLDDNTWRVGGMLSINDWPEAFGKANVPERVATVGGLIVALLGRAPETGDTVQLGNLELRAERVDGRRVTSVLLKLEGSGEGGAP
ncbi:MAG: hemolysin family protein [Planctomycetota bacterium]|jgi:CBS domain containing-hemolysin-like protein